MSYSTVLSLDQLEGEPLQVDGVKALWPYGFLAHEQVQIRYFLASGEWQMGREVQWMEREHIALNREERGRQYEDYAIRPERVKKVRRKA